MLVYVVFQAYAAFRVTTPSQLSIQSSKKPVSCLCLRLFLVMLIKKKKKREEKSLKTFPPESASGKENMNVNVKLQAVLLNTHTSKQLFQATEHVLMTKLLILAAGNSGFPLHHQQ